MPIPFRTALRILLSRSSRASAAFAILPVALFAALMLFPRAAFAQAVTLPNSPASIVKVDPSGATVSPRNVGTPDNIRGISLAECLDDDRYVIPISMTGFTANMNLEVWAGPTGSDCSDNAQRGNTSGSQTCWKVVNGNLAPTTNLNVTVKMRDIIASPTTKNLSYVAQDATVCGKIDYSVFSVYILLTSGGATQGTPGKIDFQADTIGPASVSNVLAEQGDTRLHVTWTALGSTTDEAGVTNGSTTTTATQVAIYYQAADTGSTVADAGITLACKDGSIADAGVDDSGDAQTTTVDGGCTTIPNETTSTSTCSAPGFLSTGPDKTVSKLTVNATSSDATINGLTNGTSYAVAVVAQDVFLNPGQISMLVCQSPVLLNDFFQVYRSDGGQAGGSCSLDMLGAPAGGASFAVVAFSSMLALARRRRRPQAKPRVNDEEATRGSREGRVQE